MRFGYPCINRSLTPLKNITFKLKSYSDLRAMSAIENNLNYLQQILEYNTQNNILFFRISSDLIPFASHPINTIDWVKIFKSALTSIGDYIVKHQLRISMHPSQFVLINALDPKIVNASIGELSWHVALLDALQLDEDAKVQIHVGGAYGNKKLAIERFITHYNMLASNIKRRLVIENDDKTFNASDCWHIHSETGIPIIFDNLHHECLPNGASMVDAMTQMHSSWSLKDGIPMMDYSSQEPDSVKGKHAATLNEKHFLDYVNQLPSQNVDIMFEIKDKEKSVLRALDLYPI